MTKKHKGFLQSGIIFIGDPGYMAGDMSQPGAHEIEDLTNPFRNWEKFVEDFPDDGKNLMFPASLDEGRGVALQTNRLSGQYEVFKEYGKDGKIKEIRIIFKD